MPPAWPGQARPSRRSWIRPAFQGHPSAPLVKDPDNVVPNAKQALCYRFWFGHIGRITSVKDVVGRSLHQPLSVHPKCFTEAFRNQLGVRVLFFRGRETNVSGDSFRLSIDLLAGLISQQCNVDNTEPRLRGRLRQHRTRLDEFVAIIVLAFPGSFVYTYRESIFRMVKRGCHSRERLLDGE